MTIRHDNNFGVLRLLFALLVIVAHAPEMLDGGTRREPLTMLFGTLTFGELSVDGFFLISGYLVTGSYMESRSLKSYVARRVLRIYPAFIVSYLVCILAVAPLAGVDLAGISAKEWLVMAWRMVMLDHPVVNGAFPNQAYHFLNGASWTVIYELRCYIFAALLGMAGLYRNRSLYIYYLFFIVGINVALKTQLITPEMLKVTESHFYRSILLDPIDMARFSMVFAFGAAFRLFNDKIIYRSDFAAFAFVCLLAAMYVRPVAEFGICTFGAYVLFWVVFHAPKISLNRDYDISYGVYLYGWPISALLISVLNDVPPGQLAVTTIVLAVPIGMLSWFGLEKPALALKERFSH